VALTFRATVDQPQRFARSKTVGAYFGLARRRYQSGDTDYDGRVSKCGDAMMCTALYEAAQVLLTRTQKWSWLKAWGMQVARRRGGKKATVAGKEINLRVKAGSAPRCHPAPDVD
jgi:transposase